MIGCKAFLIPLFFCLLISLFAVFLRVDAVVPHKNFVSLSIALDVAYGFDDLASRLASLDFHNFTFVVWYNSAWAYILDNATRVDLLKSYGVIIPMFNFPQTYTPLARIAWVDSAFGYVFTKVGYYPKGYMSFQPDTLMTEYCRLVYNCTYVQGYCFEQYVIDWMTMRGGWQLPYYCSYSSILIPSLSKGTVVFPHITWDWIASFTVNHHVNNHVQNIVSMYGGSVANAKNFFLRFVDASLSACSPFGFVSVQWEWSMLATAGLLDAGFDWFDTLVSTYPFDYWSYEAVADWYNANFDVNPSYSVDFVSPYNNQTVEWYWSNEKRVCRYAGKIVNYVDYTVPFSDTFKFTYKSIDWGSCTLENGVDTSIYLCFVIDRLGGGELRFNGVGVGKKVDSSGVLADYGGSGSSLLWYQQPLTFGIVILALLCAGGFVTKRGGYW